MTLFASKRLIGLWLAAFCLLTGCTIGQSQSTGAEPPPVSLTQLNPQAAGAGVPREGGELIVASADSLPAFDPFGVSKTDSALTPYESLVYRGLLRRAPDGSLVPDLAREYRFERSNGKPVVTLTLRPGAKWADGQPITAEDVRYTLEMYARPDYYGVWKRQTHLLQGVSPYRFGKAAHIGGITADAATGVIRIAVERDDIRFLALLTAPLLHKQQVAGKSPDEIDQLSRAGKLTATGPFQAEFLGEREWRFRANAHAWDGKPRLDAVRVVVVSASQLPDEIKAGRVHIAWLSPAMASRLSNDPSLPGVFKETHGNGFHFLGYNMESQPLRDVRVRRALAQALSPEALARDVFLGRAEAAKSPLAPGSFAYVPAETPPYDPQAAQSLLRQKGYSERHPLALTLVYPDHPVRRQLADEILAAWRSLPVRVETKALKPDEFAAYVFGGSPFDLYLYAWTYPDDPAGLIDVWHSREKVGELGLNASRYANPEQDRRLERGLLMLSATERRTLYADWQQTFAADLPAVPLVEAHNTYFVSRKLHGLADGIPAQLFADVRNWWLE